MEGRKLERATGIEPAKFGRLDLTDIRASYTMGLVGLSNFPAGEFPMALVKVKEKYQVTIPASLREKAGVEVGDIMEAKLQGKNITLIPKSVVDRDIEISLEQMQRGQVSRPYNSAKDFLRSLHREVKKLKKKPA
ncbi:MAG: hypothetical protein A2X89_05685 [Deltaproteobacteria bacterium GWD2_55_8]|nr:MAG: hypothetical protein A2X89_05685 [Deltaproteobacteria bacterium GWD2_55_8]